MEELSTKAKSSPVALNEIDEANSQPASLSARAYRTILRRILKGSVPLGGELSRRKLAVELGMSILPVSEALQRLQNEGIVETQPRVGTRVRIPTERDIRERYEIREALESQTARLFCRVATDEDIAELLRLGETMDSLYAQCSNDEAKDPEFFYEVQETHAKFHLHIAEAGRCAALQSLLEANQVLTFNWLYYVAAARPALPDRFHLRLAEALGTRDEEVADEAMRAHVRYGLEDVIRCIPAELAVMAGR